MIDLSADYFGANNLLRTMDDADRAALEPHLRPVELRLGCILEAPDTPIDTVYFPLCGVCSILSEARSGRKIEAGLFGRDGMSGAAVLTGSGQTPAKTVVQVEGSGLKMPAAALTEALEARPRLRAHLLLFVHAMFVQLSQTALSNGQARLEERLARWLLMCHDRIDGDTLKLTHEFLSVMLGVRRAGVTVGTHLLEGKALIRARRGEIRILDREGLLVEANDSYGVAEKEYERLLDGGRSPAR